MELLLNQLYETDDKHIVYTKSCAKAKKMNFGGESKNIGTDVRALIQYADGQTEWVPFDLFKNNEKAGTECNKYFL